MSELATTIAQQSAFYDYLGEQAKLSFIGALLIGALIFFLLAWLSKKYNHYTKIELLAVDAWIYKNRPEVYKLAENKFVSSFQDELEQRVKKDFFGIKEKTKKAKKTTKKKRK